MRRKRWKTVVAMKTPSLFPPGFCSWPNEGRKECGSSIGPGIQISSQETVYPCHRHPNDHYTIYKAGNNQQAGEPTYRPVRIPFWPRPGL